MMLDIQQNPMHAVLFVLAVIGFIAICARVGKKN